MRILLPLLLVTLATLADAEALFRLELNGQGAEERYRVRDGAAVIRLPWREALATTAGLT